MGNGRVLGTKTRGPGPYFCKGPLIRYNFRLPNLENTGPTLTDTNFIILTAFFQAATTRKNWKKNCTVEIFFYKFNAFIAFLTEKWGWTNKEHRALIRNNLHFLKQISDPYYCAVLLYFRLSSTTWFYEYFGASKYQIENKI